MRKGLLLCGAIVMALSSFMTDKTYAKTATEYSYEIIPLIDEFNEYIYVKTDNPNMKNIKFVDEDTVYDDPQYAFYVLDQTLFADVEYEDESTYRVNGGYIFYNSYSNTDGGKLSLYYKGKDTGVKIDAPRMVNYKTYLIEHYTSSDKSFFENLDSVQAALDELAIYPRGLYELEGSEGDMQYPCLAASPYHELRLNEHYEMAFSYSEYGQLYLHAYPFVLHSSSFPYTMSYIAEKLNPDCTVTYEGIHWLRTITLNGESHEYGGAGSGGSGENFRICTEKVFTFSGDKNDFATNGNLEKYRDVYFDVVEKSNNIISEYKEMLDKVWRTDGDSWYLIASEFGGIRFAYLYNAYSNYYYNSCASDTWVDGRYVDEHECWEPGAKFEDHPTSDVLVNDYKFTDVNGNERSEKILFCYDEEVKKWYGSYYVEVQGNYYTYYERNDIVLSAEDIKKLNVDRNTNTLIYNYRICDGTDIPGTIVSTSMDWSYSNGTLTVKCAGNMPTIATDCELPWSAYNADITSIVIQEGTTSIAANVFAGLSNLASVTMADSVETIDDSAFMRCKKLQTVKWSGKLKRICEYAFYGCSQLTDISFPASLEKIDALAFSECTSLKTVNIPGSVKTLGYGVFWECSSLEKCTLNEGLLSIGANSFWGCKKLANINLPAGLLYIGNSAFNECELIEEIIIPDSVTEMGCYAFYGCKSASKIVIGSNLGNIPQGAFSGCTSVNEIDIPESVMEIDSMAFHDCNSLEKVKLHKGLEVIGSSAFCLCQQLADISIPSTVTEIGNGAFEACYSIEKINIPYGVTDLEEDTFKYCYLTEIGIPLSMTDVSFLENASYIGCIFYRGSKTDWNTLTGADSEYIKNIGIHYRTDFGNHTEVITPGVPATFESDGYSDSSYCSVCGITIKPWEYLPRLEQIGWQCELGKWYYFPEEGMKTIGWKWIDGRCYYFDKSGVMQTGWIKDAGSWYYLNKYGQMITGWSQIDNNWYYFTSNGAMTTGWRLISGQWYYLKANGQMATGWLLDSNCWYYLRSTGAMSTGWAQIDSKWYYFTPSGAMITGWRKQDNHWFYFTASGHMATGWYEIDGTYYYFSENGYMTTGWLRLYGKWYYFKADGNMAEGEKVEIDGKWYKFDKSGVWGN